MPWDQEVARSPTFSALPSLGSLVPGWLLIVPRRPMLSLRELTPVERAELGEFHVELATRLSGFPGEVYAFEHGSARVGSLMGCGVDQAHLHLVPLPFDLVRVASSDAASGEIEWVPAESNPMSKLPDAGEYISVWRVGTSAGAVGRVVRPVSQWMRRLIASELGVLGQWDYRTNPQTEIIRETLEQIGTTKKRSAGSANHLAS